MRTVPGSRGGPKGTKRAYGKPSRNINKAGQRVKHSSAKEKYAQPDLNDSCSDSMFSDSDNEGSEGYRKGGYHPVKIGETYKNGQYTVLQKLGWGHFSTVWLVHDKETGDQVAMKVQKSAAHYTEAAQDEITLLTQIRDGDEHNDKCCCRLLDCFEHRGPNGRHVCMIFETLGDNLLKLIKKYKYQGIPVPIVKNITRQVLVGLDYLHRELGIIHTDLKPENVMLTQPLVSRKVVTVDEVLAKVAEKRSSSIIPSDISAEKLSKNQKKKLRKKMKKQAERANGGRSESDALGDSEISGGVAVDQSNQHDSGMDGSSWGRTSRLDESASGWHLGEEDLKLVSGKIVDFGNACWTHKKFTSDIQTRQYRCPEVLLGAKYDTAADMWSLACMVFELITGDFLFDPRSGNGYDRDEDHLALVIELLGKMPKKLALSGKYSREYFSNQGELLHIKDLKYWPLEEVLVEKYRLDRSEAKSLADFLLPMLRYDPTTRATAQEMLKSSWIEGPSGACIDKEAESKARECADWVERKMESTAREWEAWAERRGEQWAPSGGAKEEWSDGESCKRSSKKPRIPEGNGDDVSFSGAGCIDSRALGGAMDTTHSNSNDGYGADRQLSGMKTWENLHGASLQEIVGSRRDQNGHPCTSGDWGLAAETATVREEEEEGVTEVFDLVESIGALRLAASGSDSDEKSRLIQGKSSGSGGAFIGKKKKKKSTFLRKGLIRIDVHDVDGLMS
ncbi:hypothetical protein BSKO_08110 [Bryopsis sp. KO-2023]|nr:hypothetical protein BSKO_08110 [Bryopsis sp. KO-2023]